MSKSFQLKVTNLHWLEGVDNRDDYCAHGIVSLTIGNILHIDTAEPYCVSAAALLLLRSLDNGHKANGPIQLIPHCGHTMWFDEHAYRRLLLTGCNTGIDWAVEIKDDKVSHGFENKTALSSFEEYKNEVLGFSEAVLNFYATSLPKNKSDNEIERKGYELFISEWQSLHDKLNKI
ncbi:MAG: hypothetical protein U0V74_12805 [Chitinophagales bacterium]